MNEMSPDERNIQEDKVLNKIAKLMRRKRELQRAIGSHKAEIARIEYQIESGYKHLDELEDDF